MKTITQFSVQNYVVQPVALAAGQTETNDISKQKWHLTLTGVAIVDFNSTSSSDWSRETLHLLPDLRTPIQYLINNFRIPVPENPPYTVEGNGQTHYLLNVEQYTINAGLSSIFNANQSVNSGFAIQSWKPSPFLRLDGAGSAPTLQRVYDGVLVDVAVRDSDASIKRINFQINLLGRIAFAKGQIF